VLTNVRPELVASVCGSPWPDHSLTVLQHFSRQRSGPCAGEYDDADPVAYENRVQAYRDSNSRLAVSDESEDVVFEGGFRVPADIYNRLFDYQKTGTDTRIT
jgi:hypothetical protein